MQALRHRLRVFSWVALFAMAGLALAPTLSQVLAAADASNPWLQVCTTSSGSGAPEAPQGAGHVGHCPLCTQWADVLGLLPTVVAALPAPVRDAFVASSGDVAPAPSFTWVNAQPRAPPAFS